jgi:hypothetical protein
MEMASPKSHLTPSFIRKANIGRAIDQALFGVFKMAVTKQVNSQSVRDLVGRLGQWTTPAYKGNQTGDPLRPSGKRWNFREKL